jgi:hypothetical protein
MLTTRTHRHNGWTGVAQQIAQQTTAGGSLPAMGDFDGDGIADDTDACPIEAGSGSGCPAPPADPPSGTSSSGAVAPTSGGATGAVAAVNVLPAQRCVSRAVFRISINARKAHLKTARLTLDGHKVKLRKTGSRWTARLDLRHSRLARHTLTIRGRLRNGHRFKQTRHYRTCAAS